MSFTDALMTARRALDDAGYPKVTFALSISAEDALAVQHELKVATSIVEQALHPASSSYYSFGNRLLAVVHGVHIYVRES